MRTIDVVLADDHTLVRQGFRRILEMEEDITVVGECGDGRSAVALVRELRPAIVTMDIALPVLNGIEATRLIRRTSPSTLVVIVTMHADALYVRHALSAGAAAFVVKDGEDGDLVRALRTVVAGQPFFSPSISARVRELLVDPAPDGEDETQHLTGREREVLQLVAEGRTSKEVAQLLELSVNTVECHRKRAMEKLGLHNTAGLVRFAHRARLIH